MAFYLEGPDGPVSQIKAEFYRRAFMRWVHSGGDLDLAVDMLVMLRKGHTRADVVQRCGDAAFGVLDLLADSGLVYLLKSRKQGEALYKAVSDALDDLAYRLEHQGEPLARRMDDPDAEKRAVGREQMKAALARGGWRETGKGRLRGV
jgi:hypothetical protein